MKFSLKDKRFLLMKLFEIYILQGIDISDWMGKPLSFFDFNAVLKEIIRQEKSYYGDGESSILEYYPKFKKYIK